MQEMNGQIALVQAQAGESEVRLRKALPKKVQL